MTVSYRGSGDRPSAHCAGRRAKWIVLAVWVAAGLGQYQAKLQDATTNDPATFSPRERRVDPRPLDAPRTPHERPTPADPSADGSRVTNPASSGRRTSSVTAVWRSDNRDADDSANYITA